MTSGIVTSPRSRLVTQANPARGTDVAIVGIRASCQPVSYTHLDVYKRQIFLGDYLTSEGQPGAADLAMIADLGFEVVGRDADAGEVCWGHDERVLSRRSAPASIT